MQEYIDVRSIWPTYINGYTAVKLVGQPRSITVAEAREIANKPLFVRAEKWNRESYITDYEAMINWWKGFAIRNPQWNPDTHPLDRVGTINGVIAELTAKLNELRS